MNDVTGLTTTPLGIEIEPTPRHTAVVITEKDGSSRAVCPTCGWKAKQADYYRDKAWRRARAHQQAAARTRPGQAPR